jgi:hypothetical protein
MAVKEKKPQGRGGNSFRDEFIRRFKTSPLQFIGVVIVLIIVIVAFVLVPAIVPNSGWGAADLTFGSYNKVPISYAPGNYLAQVQENLARQNPQSASDDIFTQYSRQYNLWRSAFEETAVHLGALDEMKQAGYTAPEELVDRRIAEDAGMLALYRRYDNSAKMSFWREVQDEIADGYYRSDMAGFKVPAAEAAFIGAMASRQRKFALVSQPLSAYPNGEVAAYAAANPDRFRVTRLSRITLGASEREAQQILASVRGEITTFEEAAKTYSQDAYADQGGDMGQKMDYELATEIPDEESREKILSLGKGEISQVVKVPGGWAFFRAEEEAVPADTANAAFLDKIRSYIMSFERSRIEDWLLKEAADLAALMKAEGFDEVLEERGLARREFGPLPLNFGDCPLFSPQIASLIDMPELYIAQSTFQTGFNAASIENFWRVAFSTPLNTPSEPLILGNYAAILYPLEETVDESAASSMESLYSSYFAWAITSQNIQTYFVNHKKLEDRFDETYAKYFQPAF